MASKVIGILVGGGPAPGINAVIGAATIEAVNRGCIVLGFYDGLQWLASDKFDPAKHAHPLDIARVARIHFDGGSILRTSRTSLLDDEQLKKSTVVRPDPVKLKRVIENLTRLNVDSLVMIGGDDTALSGRFIAEAAEGTIRVVSVPKTIDNDLPLPHGMSTFGFSTARYFGTMIVKNLMWDSQATGRWYLVTAMGRHTGWLAASIGFSAGATITLIPEEFEDRTKVSSVVDVLDAAILKRRTMGRPDGVAVIAEGLAYRLGDRAELERLLGREVPMDAAGHPRLSEVPLGEMLKGELQKRYKERGNSISLVTHEIGYELRSVDPTPFDMGYCRTLGYGAVRWLIDPPTGATNGAIIAMSEGGLLPLAYSELIDPHTNRIRTRLVDTNSDFYRVARAYMIRLERSDLGNPDLVRKLAAEARMTPEQFVERYRRAATRISPGFGDG